MPTVSEQDGGSRPKQGAAVRQLAIVALLLLVAAGIALLLLWPHESANKSSRRAVDRAVLWGGGEVAVALDLTFAMSSSCAQTGRPLDVVLLVDSSESMRGEPLQQAVAAAKAFVNSIDLTAHRLALYLFNGQIVAAQPLTDKRDLLLGLLDSAEAQDGTAIHVALQAARQELQGINRRPGTAGVIVLLSDGGSDPASALNEAELARQAGILVGVVALRGDDFNQEVLAQVASSPATLWLAQTPEDLGRIYSDLAAALNKVIATNVQVSEPLIDSLRVVTASLEPPGQIITDSIHWELGWLDRPDQTRNEKVRFGYRVQTLRWGLHQLGRDGGELHFVDCTGAPVAGTTTAGPRLLVLPPLLCLLLPLAALLLGALLSFTGLGGLFGGKTTSGEADEIAPPRLPSPSPSTPPSGPEETAQGAFNLWLRSAENWNEDRGRTPGSWLRQRPALFVGLGEVGGRVLGYVADYLTSRWGRPWPHHIQLLHIDIAEDEQKVEETTSGPDLAPPGFGVTRIVLHPGLERLRREDIERFTGNPDYPGKGRDLGRLAIFADLVDGKGKSKLWPALANAIGELEDVSVYVVADSFSNAGSSMAADVVHLLRTMAQKQLYRVALFMAMQHADWSGLSSLSKSDLNRRTFATLRELQRLQRGTSVRFTYASHLGQSELDAESKRLFDEIVLFDGLGPLEGQGPLDLSGSPAAKGLLPAVAGCLIALLDSGISHHFYENWTDKAKEPVRRGEAFEDFASAMGSYAVRLPVDEMRRVLECRLVHKLLFDRREGYIGWEELAERNKVLQRGEVVVPTANAADVEAFLRQRRLSDQTIRLLPPAVFQHHVLDYLEVQLNRGAGARLRWALTFVDRLGETWPERKAELEPVAEALRRWLSAVGEVQAQPEKGIGSGTRPGGLAANYMKQVTARSSSDSTRNRDKEGPLYQAWQTEWERTRETFERIASLDVERLFWSIDQDYDLFRRYCSAPEIIEGLRRRLWWSWSKSESTLQLKVLVLPNALDEDDPAHPPQTRRRMIEASPEAYALRADQPARIIGSLLRLASAFSREVGAEHLGPQLGNPEGLAKEMVDKSRLMSRQRLKGVSRLAGVPFHYFAGPEASEVRKLSDAISRCLFPAQAGAEVTGSLAGLQFNSIICADQTACRLLQVEHMLTLNNMEAYLKAREQYVPRPDLQVFPEERAAAQWEERADLGWTLSPHFVEMVYHHESDLRLFSLLLIYGLMEIDTAAMKVARCQEADLQELAGERLHVAIDRFVRLVDRAGPLRDRLVQAMTEARPQDFRERMRRLDWVSDELVKVLNRTEQSEEAHDLAIVLKVILKDEQHERRV